MEINKERIKKLAKLMYDGLTAKKLAKLMYDGLTTKPKSDDDIFMFNLTEWIIALSAATRVSLLWSLKQMKKSGELSDITDEQFFEFFGEMMRFPIDQNIGLAQRYEQA